MKKNTHQHTFRLPEKLSVWLKTRAVSTNRSLSSEIVQLLEERQTQEETKAM